jgi:ribosomal protein L16/L10AE
LRLAAHKLPIKTKFVKKESGDSLWFTQKKYAKWTPQPF